MKPYWRNTKEKLKNKLGILLQSKDTNKKEDVFVFQPGERHSQVVYANQAFHTQGSVSDPPSVIFLSGSAYRLNIEGVDTAIDFNKFTIFSKHKEVSSFEFERKAATISELVNSKNTKEQAEFQWRLISGVKAFFIAIIAILLAKTSPRQGRYGKLILGVLLFFIVHIASQVMKTWVENGVVSIFPGMWNIVLGLVCLTLVLSKRYT